jgi:hypothetical protein
MQAALQFLISYSQANHLHYDVILLAVTDGPLLEFNYIRIWFLVLTILLLQLNAIHHQNFNKTLPIILRFVSGSLTPASDKKRSPESTPFTFQTHSFVLIQTF